MKDRTKEVLKDGFGSLISNAAAIRGAKAGPLWLTILFFIFSIILPIIPLFVAQVKTNGSSFLTNYSYGLERYVTKMAMDLKDKGVEFAIDEEHLLSVNENGTEVDFNEYGSSKPYAGYVDAVSNQYDFVLYLSNATSASEKNTVNKVITTTYYKTGTTTVDNEYVNGVYKNYKKFLDKSYETLKIRNTWASSGIYLGIFFGLNVIMGFLMWLLTRGKNNPNNYYTPWLTEKVQARLALAPALITLIVGFFLTSQTMLIYIITIGMRVMWTSMKELRPLQQ